MHLKKNALARVALLAAGLAFASSAYAEGSEEESDDTPKPEESMPIEVDEFLTYIEDLNQRYPDPAKLDVDRFIAEEGERAMLLYCKAIGIDGPCALSGEGKERRYVPVGESYRTHGLWDWVNNHLFNVGVIPEQARCPAPYEFVGIGMDDENRRNANWRKGWIGATLSGYDTWWRYCRLDKDKSIEFRPWQFAGNQYDYAVLALGFFCPSGGRIVRRYQDNEDGGGYAYFGDIFPNGVTNGNNWWTVYCVFDGAAQSDLGYLSDWPSIGANYGLFTSYRMPFVLERGQVFQDDEDRNNQNRWQGSPDEIMWDTRNTGRNLSRVR